jgi:hypothetical protein
MSKVAKKTLPINPSIEGKLEITETEKNKLMGINQTDIKNQNCDKNSWINCMYCEKYHTKDYYVANMNYCIHCWAWLNSHEYDIQKGVYFGNASMEDIKKVIKKAYPIHLETNCNNDECIFNKIKKHAEMKTLHNSLVELLELNKKPKLEAFHFNYKNKNLNVNFEESYIVI